MAVAESTGGTQTATLTTEHTLATVTTAGVYVLVVDVSVLANGETVDLKLKTKARTGATSRLAYQASYRHVQSEPNKYSVPVPVTTELIATLTQNGGTGRAFVWSLYTL